MKTFFKMIILMIAVMLSGCANPDKFIEKRTVDVKVLEINPPKRYYVTFQNVDDGKVTKEYISKRCSTYKKINIGQVYKIEEEVWETPDKERYVKYRDLKTVFCPN